MSYASMTTCSIEPSKLSGIAAIPPSKSHTLRALLFGLMGKGKTTIYRPLNSPDTEAMIRAIKAFGARVYSTAQKIEVEGIAGKLTCADNVIDAGNSGLVLRLIGGLAALMPSYTIITGDHSIRHSRLAKPLLDGLFQLGVFAQSARLDHYAPLIIRGPFRGGYAEIQGIDSQPVSALLIASAFADKPTEIYVKNPGETPWIDVTLHWFKYLGLPYTRSGYTYYSLPGGGRYSGFSYTVPADLSSLSYPLAAALVTRSSLTLKEVDMSDIQGDKALIFLLKEMGASLHFDLERSTLSVSAKGSLKGRTIDINPLIDALPLLAVLGCYAEGETVLYNGECARYKECDRIACIVKELKKMGADIQEKKDGIVVRRSSLHGATLDSHSDHRIAMSLVIASLYAKTPSTLDGATCIAKTYPYFIRDFNQLGARIKIV